MNTIINTVIIGGTGMGNMFENFGFLSTDHLMTSPYGDPVHFKIWRREDGLAFLFISRHDSTGQHRLAPDLRHRDYLYAVLKLNNSDSYCRSMLNIPGDISFDIRYGLSTTAVGALTKTPFGGDLKEGDLFVPDDLIRLFHDKRWSFHVPGKYVHPEAFYRTTANLICPHIQDLLVDVSGGKVKKGGILGCAVPGPSYETGAEVDLFAAINILVGLLKPFRGIVRKDMGFLAKGIDFLGMATVTPELLIFRQLGRKDIGFHAGVIAVITDLPQEEKNVTGEQVAKMMARVQAQIAGIFVKTLERLKEEPVWEKHSCVSDTESPYEVLGDPAEYLSSLPPTL